MYDHSTLAADAHCACPPEKERPVTRPLHGLDAERELAELAKALGHPARVRIVRLLTERGDCVCGDIVKELPLAQSTVSQHLKILKEAGFVRGDVDGPRVCYCLSRAVLDRAKALMAAL